MNSNETKKIYDKNYYEKNKLKRQEQKKKYRQDNYEEQKRKNTERYKLNKEKYNKTRRDKYKMLEDTYKKSKLSDWKRKGIIIEENSFKKFFNTKKCELCDIEFCEVGGKTKKNKKCLDHDHLTGHIRVVCCVTCNNYLKKYDNLRLKLMLELHRYKNL